MHPHEILMAALGQCLAAFTGEMHAGLAPLFAWAGGAGLGGDPGLRDRLLGVVLNRDVFGYIVRTFLILLPAGLGVYLMLPRGLPSKQPQYRRVGAALAAFSLVLICVWPVSEKISGGAPRTVLWLLSGWGGSAEFYLLGIVSLASAVLTITSRNPVYSALWFSLVLLANAGLYLIQHAEFLAAATAIVYAGAILVTFLFVLMLAQPQGAASYDRVSREPFLACLTGLLLAGVLLGTIHYSTSVEAIPNAAKQSVRPTAALARTQMTTARETSALVDYAQPHVANLGKSLFQEHFVSIEIVGVLLLAAVVGAMLIAGHTSESPR